MIIFDLFGQLQKSKFGNYFIHYKTKEKQPIYYINLDNFNPKNKIIVELPKSINISNSDFFIRAGNELLFDFTNELDLIDLVNYSISILNNTLTIEIKNIKEFKNRIKTLKKIQLSFPASPFSKDNQEIKVITPKVLIFGFNKIEADKRKLEYWYSLSIIERMQLKEREVEK